MDGQDWETVTIRGKKGGKAKANELASSGFKQSSDIAQIRKLAENDIVKMKQLSKESRQELVAIRASQKMTQLQLNQLCQFPIHTIQRIESGQHAPTVSQLNTLNRVLKVGLKYE